MGTTNWEHREMLGVINASSQSLLRILNDVLDISKVEAGHLGLHLTAVSVPEVVRNVAMTFAEAAKQKGLTLEWSIDPEIAHAHTCDPVRLRQVILKRRATPSITGTGACHPRVRAVCARSEQLAITVTDTALDFPEDQAVSSAVRQADSTE